MGWKWHDDKHLVYYGTELVATVKLFLNVDSRFSLILSRNFIRIFSAPIFNFL